MMILGSGHGFGAEASLPLTQSAPAVSHDITRLCQIDVTLWDCQIATTIRQSLVVSWETAGALWVSGNDSSAPKPCLINFNVFRSVYTCLNWFNTCFLKVEQSSTEGIWVTVFFFSFFCIHIYAQIYINVCFKPSHLPCYSVLCF